MKQQTDDKPDPEVNTRQMWGMLVLGLIIVAGLGYLVTNPSAFGSTSEWQFGMVIIFAVSILAFILFVMASGFRALGLTDKRESLALPSGSIRAFIALILIMVFVILSVYSIRLVGLGGLSYLGRFTQAQIEKNKYSGEGFDLRPVGNGQDAFDVFQSRPLTEDGSRLAQQLMTTVATLVVSVSAFYFGAKSAEAAKNLMNSGEGGTQRQGDQTGGGPGSGEPKTGGIAAIESLAPQKEEGETTAIIQS